MHKNSNNPERKAKILLVFSMFVWVDVWVGGRLFSCGWVPILTSQPGKVIWKPPATARVGLGSVVGVSLPSIKVSSIFLCTWASDASQ